MTLQISQDTLAAMRRAAKRPIFGSLEDLITSDHGFGLKTATAAQRAICRVSDGTPLGELWDMEPTEYQREVMLRTSYLRGDHVIRAIFGGSQPPQQSARWMCILGSIRSFKSLFAAGKAIMCSQTCDLSATSAGDEIRIPVLSTDKDAAHAVFSHLIGQIEAKPALRKLLVTDKNGKPKEPTADSVFLRHPSGKEVEIKVTAIARAGSTLVGRWLAGAVFDEAPRMVGEEDGVKNLDEALRAVQGRFLPGSQGLLIGSPWAPFGPVYDLVKEHFGKPSEGMVVVRAPGPIMNPYYWTPERCEQMRLDGALAYQTDVLGEFADPESSLISDGALRACTRMGELELPPKDGYYYIAAMDPATRGNAWTLVLATRLPDGRRQIVLCREWMPRGGNPLDPDAVFGEMAALLKRYRVSTVRTDQWAVDALAAVARRHELALLYEDIGSARRLELYDGFRVLLETKQVEVPAHDRLHEDLKRIRKVLTQSGVRIVLPQTADGRHCDYAPPTVLVCGYPCSLPDIVNKPVPGSEAWYKAQMAEEKRRVAEEAERHNNQRKSLR